MPINQLVRPTIVRVRLAANRHHDALTDLINLAGGHQPYLRGMGETLHWDFTSPADARKFVDLADTVAGVEKVELA